MDDLLGPEGRVLSEYEESRQAWTRTEIAAGGRALGSYNPQTGATTLAIADELGTVRARTDLAGNVQERYTSLPFGDLLTTWNDNWQPTSPEVGAISPLHFTGQPRDAETGLDYFGARNYASRLGRWMTPDWSAQAEPVPYAKLDNPQSLNLYSYVLNNPVSRVDPDGHCCDPDEIIISTTTAAGGIIGGAIGGLGGAGAGTLVAPGIGTVGGGFEGAITGAAAGTLAGASLGKAIVGTAHLLLNKSKAAAAAQGTSSKNSNPYAGPVSAPVTVVDQKGNAIPVGAGEQLQGSKDGTWTQVKDANGRPTGTRIDGGHPATSHVDPRAQVPHAHVPGRTNIDGTPWLPLKN